MAENDKAKLTFDEVAFWLAEAHSCQKRQDKELKERNSYPYIINYYEGDQRPNEKHQSQQKRLAFINEYFPNVNALIADIMYQNHDIIATATRPIQEEMQEKFATTFPKETGIEPEMVMKSALTYAFNKLEAIDENRLALFDMIMAGYSAVEVNHINVDENETVPVRGDEKSVIGKIGDKIKKAMRQEDIEEEVEKTIPPKEIMYSTPDETYLRRWNPLDILLDYRADRVKDLRYIIKIIRYSHAEFSARYPKFKNDVQANTMIPFSEQAKDTDKKSIKLYEFQVKQRNNQYINFIISPTFKLREIDYFERPYTTNGFNVKIGTLNDYGKLYPISRGKINKAIQDDINNYTTFLMEVAERNVPKFEVLNDIKADAEAALRSSLVNDLVKVEKLGSVNPLQPTKVAVENKELLAMFDRHKDKLWSVSGPRQGETGKAKFATELDIQEAGFQANQADIQQGLRRLIRAELNTLKDIIVQFWDNPMFIKITGAEKPAWYIPKIAEDGTVLNPLTDILTRDYEIDVDIVSSMRPNKEKIKSEQLEYITLMLQPNTLEYLASQGLTINPEALKKTAKDWGHNPDTLFIEFKPQGGQGEGVPEVPQPGAAEQPQVVL